MIDSVKISEILLDANAVAVSLTNPYQYASGILSPIYTNCRVLSSYPEQRALIISALLEKCAPILGGVDAVAGAGTSSISLAGLLSQRLNMPMVYVRSSAKKHGKGRLIEGALSPGSKVLLVADIISTEGDIPHAVEAIREQGASVIYCIAVFSNNLGSVEAFLEKERIPYGALTDLPTVLESALRRGRISQEQRCAIEEWAQDVEGWNQKHQDDIHALLEANARKIAQVLLDINAVSVRAEQPFRYASGILSPIYTDNRLLISHPEKWKTIIDSFVDVIKNVIGLENFDVLAGTATSGIPHAALIADRLDVPLVYVDFERDRERGQIEGKLTRGDRAIIIEDHVTTGNSVLSSVSALQHAGALVPWCVSIFTYLTEDSQPTFAKEQIDFRPLCSLKTLLDVAHEMNRIEEKEVQAVLSWVSDPENWRPSSSTEDQLHACASAPEVH